MSAASEDRSSVESVKTEDVLLFVDDKKAEAARRSSSRSETVRRELPMDRVEDIPESKMAISSAAVPTEKKPDSQDPRRRSGYPDPDPLPVGVAVAEDPELDEPSEEFGAMITAESSWVIQLPPE